MTTKLDLFREIRRAAFAADIEMQKAQQRLYRLDGGRPPHLMDAERSAAEALRHVRIVLDAVEKELPNER